MKTLFKFLQYKAVLMFTLSLMFFAAACENPQHTTSENGSAKEEKIKPPKMDLHAAILSDNMEVIQKHIEAGTDLNMKEPMAGSTPLITASVFGKTDAAKALIDAGADMNITNNDGSTALHVASFFCRTEIVEMLVSNGADKTMRNNFGATALESVSAPYNQVAAIYSQIKNDMKPLGLQLDLEYVEKIRPEVANLLK